MKINKMNVKLALVLPCYNEEEVLPETFKRLVTIIQNLGDKNKITQESHLQIQSPPSS